MRVQQKDMSSILLRKSVKKGNTSSISIGIEGCRDLMVDIKIPTDHTLRFYLGEIIR